MVALIVAPGQYVRPRMFFVYGLRTKGLSAPKLRCLPSLGCGDQVGHAVSKFIWGHGAQMVRAFGAGSPMWE
jgi:hypothetical protein